MTNIYLLNDPIAYEQKIKDSNINNFLNAFEKDTFSNTFTFTALSNPVKNVEKN